MIHYLREEAKGTIFYERYTKGVHWVRALLERAPFNKLVKMPSLKVIS